MYFDQIWVLLMDHSAGLMWYCFLAIYLDSSSCSYYFGTMPLQSRNNVAFKLSRPRL